MTALGQSGFDISKVLTLEVPLSSASGGAASGGAVSGGTASGGTVSGGTASGGAAAGTTVPATQKQFVVLVAARTPERVRPFDEVRAQVEQAALQQQRNQAQQTWLDGLRKKFPVENLLASAQTPTATQDATQSGGVQSGGTQSGGAAVGNVPSIVPSAAASGGGTVQGSSSSQATETGQPNNGAATNPSSPNQPNTAGSNPG